MLKLGLLGQPVGHSLSPAIHRAALEALGLADQYRYAAHDVSPAALADWLGRLRAGGWRGVNLTHPHKVAALPLLDDPGAGHALGAVNTIVVEPGGRLVGHNTDAPGFLLALRELCATLPSGHARSLPTRAVLLGAGGAARAIAHALAGQGCRVDGVCRQAAAGEELLARLGAAAGVWAPWGADRATAALFAAGELLVGCTPLGAAVRAGEPGWASALAGLSRLPFAQLDPGTPVIDIVYTPPRTPLLELAAAQGCPTQGGLEMLVAQAALSCELWTGRRPPRALLREAATRALRHATAGGGP